MRVYELAKELKVDQKELLKELQDMGIDVLNHMSVVGPDDTHIIRERFRAQRAEVVEEKRVTTKVIRRRRKKVPRKKDAEPGEGPDDLEGPETDEDETEVEAPVAAAPPEDQPVAQAEAEAPEAAPETAPEAPAAQAPPEPEAPAEEPAPVAEQAAAPPEAQPEPEAPAAEPVAEKAEPAPEAPAEAPAPAAEAPAAAEAAAPAQEEPEAQAQPETAAPAEAPEAPAPKAEAKPAPKSKAKPKAEAKDEPKPEPKAKAKPKKRGLDEPARIISKPTTPVPPVTRGREETRPPLRRGPRPAAPPVDEFVPGAVPPPDKGDDRSRRRKKGKKGGAIPNDEELMRKAGGRRKAVLDKADLYGGKPGRGRRKGGTKKIKKTEVTTPKAIKRRVKVGEAITVGELAKRMGVKAAEMVGRLMKMGMMVTSNQSLDVEDAALVAAEFGFEIDRVGFEESGLLEQQQDRPEDLKPRAPVVTIMGHVDHGKTSLLDTIRKAEVNVTDGEAGGITQHIGAYDVSMEGGGRVVFVDTPGHEAFTQMRARGAQVTDVVVLVVAADDGVMEQTKEAIAHSKAAKVPIVVAVNKIDKPGADPARVRRELAEFNLVPEDWGGDTIFVDVSAKTGEGVSTLLEMLELQSEVLELAANADKPARGYALEARLDKGRGPVGTVLVQEGTLKTGDAFVCGIFAGKVRAMLDDRGQRLDEAGPATPVEVWGMGGVPEAGDEFVVVEDEKAAKQIAEHRALKKREAELSAKTKMSLDSLFEKMQEGEVLVLPLVVKADVQGSVEALVDALGKLGNEQVKVEVIHSGTGAITETDVMLASASGGVIIGFNVRPAGKVSDMAEAEKVDIRTYDVIYQVLEDMHAALTGMLAPVQREEVLGRVEVRDTFHVPKVGTVAGCYVTSGHVERGAMARLLREGVVIATGKISSLRRFKDDVKEVQQGYECGMSLENYNDIKVGDEIEIFVIREEAAQL